MILSGRGSEAVKGECISTSQLTENQSESMKTQTALFTTVSHNTKTEFWTKWIFIGLRMVV